MILGQVREWLMQSSLSIEQKKSVINDNQTQIYKD